MKKTYFPLLLALLLVLCGCGKDTNVSLPEDGTTAAVTEPTETTVPSTLPSDGNPDDVTCKGSYTADGNGSAIIATVGDAELTNQELQVWYWAEVAQYQQEQHEIAPDFDRPLDVQTCEIDDSVASWQQYFLREALNAWHNAQALILQSEEVPMPTEEAYQPNLDNYEIYLTDIPATKYLYGYNVYYQTNTLHQEYLDSLPETLDELAAEKGYSDASAMAKAAFGAGEQELDAFAEAYNRGYMYFTAMSYYIEPTEEELTQFYAKNQNSYTESGKYVDIRHILLVPDEPAAEADATEPVAKDPVTI